MWKLILNSLGVLVGWWKKDEPLKVNEPWTYQKRFVHGQSEMTKFVDGMLLIDPSFRLYWLDFYYYYIEKKKKCRLIKNIKYLNIAQYRFSYFICEGINYFRLRLENTDWILYVEFVGLVIWFNGREFLCGSPRVCGIKLFNEISNLPWADDQVF